MSGRWCGLAPSGGRVGNRQGKQGLPEPRPKVAPSAPAGRGAEGWVHPGYILRVNPPSMADLQRKKPMDFCLVWSCHFKMGKDGRERGPEVVWANQELRLLVPVRRSIGCVE